MNYELVLIINNPFPGTARISTMVDAEGKSGYGR